jgi:hypothetical protein
MESWYGLLWKHKNRHGELLRAAVRARRAKDLLKHEHARDHALDADDALGLKVGRVAYRGTVGILTIRGRICTEEIPGLDISIKRTEQQ